MPSKIKNIFHLLRVRQYYKNALIFVGIFFSQRLFDFSLYYHIFIGFILLCCASSFNYIVNDIRDIESDKLHPEKLKKKPLASGALSLHFAILLLIILTGLMILFPIFIIPKKINIAFSSMMLLLIVTGQLYNYFFKNYVFIDILILSTGYLWRALAGCMIIEEYVSPWLLLAIFEIAIFLSIAKRKGDLIILGKDRAIEHKKVYDQYSQKLLDQFYVIVAGSLFLTYSLYLINRFKLDEPGYPNIFEYFSIFTIPISLYILIRYMYLTSAKPEIARNTERAFLDKGIIIAGLMLMIVLFFSFYFN